MKRTLILLWLSMLMPAAHATDLTGLPQPLADRVAAARQACADVNHGEFALEWGAVSRTDLDGDDRPEWVVDESAFSCSTAVSLFCGTGGCTSHFLVGRVITSLLNQGWTIATFGRKRILLLDVHGSDCGGNSWTPCVVAYTWDAEAGGWRSVSAKARQ